MSDDRLDPITDPAADPDAALDSTNPYPTDSTGKNMTEQLPAGQPERPLRVEPASPVPDDALPPEGSDTAVLPQLQAPPPPATSAAEAWQPPERQGLVTVRRGPLPVTIMLGLLSLIVSAYVLVTNLTTADLNLRLVGPTMFGAVGALLLIVGLFGVLAGGRGRGSD